MQPNDNDSGPAYKQPWFWMILAPLLTTFCVGFFMLYVSIVTADGPVVDSYYKDGFDIKVRTEQDIFATQQNLSATLIQEGDKLKLNLAGQLESKPDQLSLHVIFTTSKSRDVYVDLTLENGFYVGKLDEPITNRRKLQLSGPTKQWRLHSDSYWPLTSPVILEPKVR